MTFGSAAIMIAAGAIFGRSILPWHRAIQGRVVHREYPALLARMRAHAVPGLILQVLSIGGLVGGWVAPSVALAVFGSLAILVLLPMPYTLTTVGIQQGHGRVRRWSEFAGVARQQSGARLQGGTGARGMTVWLAGSRDADDTVLLLRKLVRGSYKGEANLDLGGSGKDLS